MGIPDPAAVEAEPLADSEMAAPTGIPVTPAFEPDTQACPIESGVGTRSSPSFLILFSLPSLIAQTHKLKPKHRQCSLLNSFCERRLPALRPMSRPQSAPGPRRPHRRSRAVT